MQGLHLTADLTDCQCATHWLTDAQALGAAVERAVAVSGLSAVGRLFHTFPDVGAQPGGVTATVLLAESHVCVHTWPELRAVTLDVYVCHFSGDHSEQARELMTRLIALFKPMRAVEHTLHRGQPHVASTLHAAAPAPAIVLAAGRGERMRPLTDTCPKPLLPVQGQPLLMWHVRTLLNGGCTKMAINTAWLGEKIKQFFDVYRTSENKSSLYCLNPPDSLNFALAFSDEQADFGAALETAGGIARALPLLGNGSTAPDAVFWVVAGDVFVPSFSFSQHSVDRFRASNHLAHIWLVPNPPHHPRGDFGLGPDGLALNLPATDTTTPRFTYSTIGLYRAALFGAPWCDIPSANPTGVKAPLAPLLRRAMDAGRVSAELYTGPWTDVGTPERLAQLNNPSAHTP